MSQSAITILKNSFHKTSGMRDTDTISLLGQKVTYKDDVKSVEYKTNKHLYMFTYAMMVISLGCKETFGATIYTELGRQLDVGTDVIAFIFLCKSISFGISAILSAWILDYFHETHGYISFTMLLSSISTVIIPFTHNTALMYILFIIIGYSLGAIFVGFPVYVFRLYPKKQSLMMYILLTIYGIAKVVLPLIIQLSIFITDEYHSALFIIAIISIFDCICLLFVVTPQHDELRTIKADISNKRKTHNHNNHNNNTNSSLEPNDFTFGNISDDHTTSDNTMSSPKPPNNLNSYNMAARNNSHGNNEYIEESNSGLILESQTELEDISNQVSFVLRNNKKHVMYEWILVILLSIDMALWSATQTGLVYFITTYCDEYLNINESNGRFMISCYFLGQLLYRFFYALFVGDKFRNLFSKTITLGFIVMTIFSLIFLIWPKNIIILYFVYSICGIFGSGIFPDIYKWCESMKPVSGILSCLYIIGFSGGDAMMILLIGELFAKIGAYILPQPILIANLIGLITTVCLVILYRKYEKNKASILCTFYNGT